MRHVASTGTVPMHTLNPLQKIQNTITSLYFWDNGTVEYLLTRYLACLSVGLSCTSLILNFQICS